MLKDSPATYGMVTRSFHWALTALVIAMLILSWVMTSFPPHSPVGNTLTRIHRRADDLAGNLVHALATRQSKPVTGAAANMAALCRAHHPLSALLYWLYP